MSKKPNLAETFKVDENELQPKQVTVLHPKTANKETKPKKKHIGGYFNEDVYRQVKIIGAEKGLTTQDILAEGLNAVFRMHDKPPIA